MKQLLLFDVNGNPTFDVGNRVYITNEDAYAEYLGMPEGTKATVIRTHPDGNYTVRFDNYTPTRSIVARSLEHAVYATSLRLVPVKETSLDGSRRSPWRSG